MQIDTSKTHTNIRAVLDDKITLVDASPGYYSGTLCLTHNGIQLTDSLEYDENHDAYFHMSDDGSQFYHVTRFITADEAAAGAPDLAETQRLAAQNVAPLAAAVAQGKIHPAEMIYTLNIMNSPAYMHRAWLASGRDVDAAQKEVANQLLTRFT